MQDHILVYLVLINILTMATFRLDKWLAKRGMYRVPENTLLGLAAAGGGLGGLAGMYLFHHKTRLAKFRWGVPAIIIAELFLVYFLGR